MCFFYTVIITTKPGPRQVRNPHVVHGCYLIFVEVAVPWHTLPEVRVNCFHTLSPTRSAEDDVLTSRLRFPNVTAATAMKNGHCSSKPVFRRVRRIPKQKLLVSHKQSTQRAIQPFRPKCHLVYETSTCLLAIIFMTPPNV